MTSKNWELLLLGLAVGLPVGALILYALMRRDQTLAKVAAVSPRAYTNNEEWTIVRDEQTGRTLGVKGKRDAKES